MVKRLQFIHRLQCGNRQYCSIDICCLKRPTLTLIKSLDNTSPPVSLLACFPTQALVDRLHGYIRPTQRVVLASSSEDSLPFSRSYFAHRYSIDRLAFGNCHFWLHAKRKTRLDSRGYQDGLFSFTRKFDLSMNPRRFKLDERKIHQSQNASNIFFKKNHAT